MTIVVKGASGVEAFPQGVWEGFDFSLRSEGEKHVPGSGNRESEGLGPSRSDLEVRWPCCRT